MNHKDLFNELCEEYEDCQGFPPNDSECAQIWEIALEQIRNHADNLRKIHKGE